MNKFLSYIQYNWIKYLLIIVIPLVFWAIIYSDIDQVKYDESVKILYIGDDLDEEKLQDDILSKINTLTNQELKYVSVMNYTADEELIYEYLRSKVYSVDIVIISHKYFNEEFISQIFVPLTTRLKQDFLNVDLVKIKENEFGLNISNDSSFYQFCANNEGASIFLSQYSLNIGKAYGYGKVGNDAAISIARYISGVK